MGNQNEAADGRSGSTAELDALPCPFCGKHVEDDGDTLYPSGTGWSDDKLEGFRVYLSRLAVPKEQWCWGMHCSKPSGGCGAQITGDSKEEALSAWNRRASNVK